MRDVSKLVLFAGLSALAVNACSGEVSTPVADLPDTGPDVGPDAGPDAAMTDTSVPDAVVDTSVPETSICTAGQITCDEACVDPKTSREHCGACGTACADGQVCSDGACATSCGAPLAKCEGDAGDGGASYCANLQTDNANCGACGTTCPAGQVCSAGACTTTCGASLTLCGGGDAGPGYCANTASDNANCGACGVACPSSTTCVSGACNALVLSGTVEFLQGSGPLVLENGPHTVTVTANGAFTIPTLGASTYDVKIKTQPPGQRCVVVGGAGSVSAAKAPKVLCPVARSSKKVNSADLDTTSSTYVDVDGLAPVTFTTGTSSAQVLLSLHVPFASGDPALGVNGEVHFAIEVDSTIVAEGVQQAAFWGQPGPVTIVDLANVGPGDHTVKAKWKKGPVRSGTPTVSRIAAAHETLLSATVLESLPTFAAAKSTTVSSERTTTSTTSTSLGVPSLSFEHTGPALVGLMAPSILTTDNDAVTLDLTLDGAAVATGTFFHEASAKSVALLALPTLAGSSPHAVDASWKVSAGTATAAAMASDLLAVGFRPGTTVLSSTRTGSVSTSATSFSAIPDLATIALSPTHPTQALVTFQAPSAWSSCNGTAGEIELDLDGTKVSGLVVQSQNASVSQVPTMVALVDVPAGTHTLQAQWKSNACAFVLGAGTTSLGAIVLH